VYFGRVDLDGGRTYTQTYPKAALPESKARYFWSVVAVDNVRYRVIPNALDRHLLNKQSKLTPNADDHNESVRTVPCVGRTVDAARNSSRSTIPLTMRAQRLGEGVPRQQGARMSHR